MFKENTANFHTTNIYKIKKKHNSKISGLAECLNKWNIQPTNFSYKYNNYITKTSIAL